MPQKISPTKQRKALEVVAKHLGPMLGHIKPCGTCEPCKAGLKYDFQCDDPSPVSAPTGQDAADSGLGPMLVPDFDWVGSSHPAIVLEGGPEDWAIALCLKIQPEMNALGIHSEPATSWALSLYPDN